MTDPLNILGKKFSRISQCLKNINIDTIDKNLMTDLQSGNNIDRLLEYFIKKAKPSAAGILQDKKVYILSKIELINKRLEKIFSKTDASIRFFHDTEELIKKIDKIKINTIVCDWDYGETTVIALLRQIRMIHPQIIMIILLNDNKNILVWV